MGKYDDIINLPHWDPKYHHRMSPIDRAGQFAPFAALTGYDAMVSETTRLTGSRIELDEEQKNELNDVLAEIIRSIGEHPRVRIEYFVPDTKKSGGEYVSVEDAVRDVELPNRRIILKDGKTVSLDDVLMITILK